MTKNIIFQYKQLKIRNNALENGNKVLQPLKSELSITIWFSMVTVDALASFPYRSERKTSSQVFTLNVHER